MHNDEEKAAEIKCYNRIKYNPHQRPKLRTEKHTFEVVEITDNDIWLTSDVKTNLDKKIQGLLTLLNGESLDIEGIVIWKKDNDFGLKFENLQLSDMLLKELRYLVKP